MLPVAPAVVFEVDADVVGHEVEVATRQGLQRHTRGTAVLTEITPLPHRGRQGVGVGDDEGARDGGGLLQVGLMRRDPREMIRSPTYLVCLRRRCASPRRLVGLL